MRSLDASYVLIPNFFNKSDLIKIIFCLNQAFHKTLTIY